MDSTTGYNITSNWFPNISSSLLISIKSNITIHLMIQIFQHLLHKSNVEDFTFDVILYPDKLILSSKCQFSCAGHCFFYSSSSHSRDFFVHIDILSFNIQQILWILFLSSISEIITSIPSYNVTFLMKSNREFINIWRKYLANKYRIW